MVVYLTRGAKEPKRLLSELAGKKSVFVVVGRYCRQHGWDGILFVEAVGVSENCDVWDSFFLVA